MRHRSIALLILLLINASSAFAEHPLHRLGVGQTMEGALPFEQVDPLSGNLVVTATDLVLPGNAGFDLRVTRIYNSAIYPRYAVGDLDLEEDSWAGIGWRLHFGRVLHPYATGSGQTVIEMGDGSRHPLYTTGAFAEGWITRGLALYDRGSHTLRVPNGMVYVFGREVSLNDTLGVVRCVTEIRDPFDNRLTFEYFGAGGPPDGVQRIRQELGGSQVREVTFTYDAALKNLATMTFFGRTWTYEQTAAGPAGHGVLRTVRPPAGLPWEYEYSTAAPGHELRVIRTPLGGTVTYTYGDAVHHTGSIATRTRVVTTRAVGGRDVTPGTWTFTYAAGPDQDETHVASPSLTTTTYIFYGHGLTGDFSPWLVGQLAERVVASGGVELERDAFTYVRSEPASPDYLPGEEGMASSNGVFNALLATRNLTRDGETFTTTYTYRTGEGTFNDYGQPWEISEETNVDRWRRTTRTFQHAFTPYIRGRITSEERTQRTGYDQFSGPAISSWTYDPATGFLLAQNQFGITQTFERTAQGNVAVVRDALDRTTVYQYAWGRVSRMQTAHVTADFWANWDGTIATGGVGTLWTSYEYDAAMRLRVVRPPNANPITYDFDDDVGRDMTASRGGATTLAQVDGFGRIYFTQDPAGVKTRAEYDACGRETFASAPYTSGWGQVGVTTTYDGLGRPRTRTHSDGSATRLDYGGLTVTITDPENRATVYEYLDFGAPSGERVIGVTDAAGQITTYRYDVLNNLTHVSVPGVPTRTWVYDGTRLMSETHPESGQTTYTYDAAGNRTTRTDALGVTTEFHYDASNRLWKIDPPGTADDVTVTFDPVYGRITAQATAGVTTTFGYDSAGRLNARTDAIGSQPAFASSYTYDGNDLLRTLTYPSGRVVTYDYDAVPRLTTVRHNGAVFADLFTYGDTGALASYRTGAVTHTVTLDARERIGRLTALNAASQGLDLTYAYDRVSQVSQIADPRDGMTQVFGYDAVGRLRTAMGPWGIREWAYNAAGDRLLEQQNGFTTHTYAYGPATRRLDATTGPNPEAFSYDTAGRLTADTRGTYSYTAHGLLQQATTPGATATYAYDPAGLRVARTVNGQTTYTTRSPDGQPLSEYREGCAGLVWTRDTVYALGRPLGAVRASVTAPTVSVTAAAATRAEAGGTWTGSVVMTTPGGAPTTCPITVAYHTVAGAAAAGLDFATTAGTLTFPAGTASGTTLPVSVPIVADAVSEADEAFSLALSSADGATLAGSTATVITIQDDDPPPTLTIANGTGAEGTGGSGLISLALTLSAASGRPVTVAYTTADRTAVAPGDYGAVSGTVTLPPGATTATIQVPTGGDADDEPDETFAVVLSTASGATLARWIAHGRILDDDGGEFLPARDFNQDGWPDLVWRHAVTGQISLWYMQGITELWGILTDPPQLADFDWEIRAVGDFNGDWKPDVVWQRRTDGYLSAWFFDRHVVIGMAAFTTLSGGPTEPDLAWKIVAAADMDRDGQDDVIWRREGTGQLRIWHMSGMQQIDSVPLAYGVGTEPWQVVGTGDMNRDGSPDLVWRHDTTGGLSTRWMTDAQLVSWHMLFPDALPDVQWRIVDVADMNRDGHADLVWQHVDGRISAWFMNGLALVSGELMVPASPGTPNWQVQGVR